MRRSPPDLIAVAVVAIAATVVALLPDPLPYVRPLLTIPLVLVLPGYALVRAALPRPLGRAELAVLSICASLALAAAGGALLGLLGVPLVARTWAVMLGAVTIVGVVIALARREPFEPPDLGGLRRRLPLFQTSLLVYAVVVAGVAVYASPRSIEEQGVTGYTQLWMLPATADPTASVRLGVANGEPAATTYRLELRAGGQVIAEWPQIKLDPGQTWEQTLAAPRVTGGLRAFLTRPDVPGFSRHVLLELPLGTG